MLVTLNMASSNRKTGTIPVSTTEQKSCPSTCAFYDKGCYAKYGPLGLHWRKTGERGVSWGDFVGLVKRIGRGQLWRHNQAGDLPGDGLAIDNDMLTALVSANRGKRGFTYTHKPVLAGKGVNDATLAANRKKIKLANDKGFTVNLSADNLQEADRLANLSIGPVVVVLPIDAEQGKMYTTPEGRKVVTCPAARADLESKGINCANCQLCAVGNRKSIVGFPAHGTAKKTVNIVVGQ